MSRTILTWRSPAPYCHDRRVIERTARSPATPLAHAALVVAAFTVFFCWVFARLLLSDVYLAESDLYDWFLPFFLSPPATWTSDIFGGLPLFADTSDAIQYPVYFFFARVVGSWAGYVISAYVIAASLTYAYVFILTRSRTAAAVAGVAYGLSEAMIGRQAHINFVHAFAWFPLMVLAVDRLASGASWRWVALGAAATACCFLSGHPQPVLYASSFCVVYALVAAIAQRAPAVTYARLAAVFGLAALLMSIKAVPFVEATRYIGRQAVGFDQFVSHANSPSQMLSLMFPSISHDVREASVYVGFTVMTIAALSLGGARRDWRVVVWAITAVVVALVGMGSATPVARLLYLLPIYKRSRVITRMMFIFAFAVASLAGLGFAALQRRAISRRAVEVSLGIMFLGIAAGAAGLAAGLDVRFEWGRAMAGSLPWWNVGVWQQILIAAVALAWLLVVARQRTIRGAGVVALLLVIVDLLHGSPYAVTASGLRVITIPVADVRPSVHARRIAEELAPLHQRWLAVAGTTRDTILPSGFARLWRIPVAGGYGPILLGNFQALATAGNNGDVRPETLAFDDAGLDLLAVRYVAVRDDDFAPPPTFERAGHTWSEPELNMRIGRDDCGYRYRREKSIRLSGRSVDRLSVVAHLRCSEDVPQGAEVGSAAISGIEGAELRQPFVAGMNIAEHALSEPAVSARAKHAASANRFDDPQLSPDVFLVDIDLPKVVRDPTITFEGAATGGWLSIDRLTVHGPDGADHPQSLVDLFLHDTRRWKEVRRIHTSAETDRQSDESSPIEHEYTIYENLHSLPRAWMVPRVTRLGDADAQAAIRFGQLPDGTRFDPRLVAIVDPDDPDIGTQDFAGQMRAQVDQIVDGRITITANSERGGFLVLSETSYPGWRARVDGEVTAILRTDVSLQGVRVPPGTHTVLFEFAPPTLRLGQTLSLAGLMVCAGLIFGTDRRQKHASERPGSR